MKHIITTNNLFYIAVLLIFTGCSKLQTTVTPVLSNSTSKSVVSSSYYPTTTGSYWKYAVTINGVTDTETSTITGLTTMYGGQTFYEKATSFALNKFPGESDYLAKNSDIYTELSIAKADTLNLYYFNDTTALNNYWVAKVNNSGIINNQSARLIGGIVEQNTSLNVKGKTYTGVTHSKIYLQYYSDGTNYTTAEIYDYFIVKGIGPIEIFKANSTGTFSSEALLSYVIK